MAAIQTSSIFSSLRIAVQTTSPQTWQLPILLLRLSTLSLALPAFNPIPGSSSLLQDIWDGILRAVPKQRKSYSRTRSRQMAGKALKDVTNIVKCSACGRPKKSHLLCPYCVLGMFSQYKNLNRVLILCRDEELFQK